MPSDTSTGRTDQSVEELRRELAAAREQQAATSELLKVIGRSTFDLQLVFDALADSAVRLCEAERSLIYRLDGDRLRVAASHNATAEVLAFLERNPMPQARASAAGRASVERRTIHIEDVLADPEYTYGATQVDPVRTVLAIPMLRREELLGVIVIYRHEVRPFTTSQIALMETFADQAVIAIENTRLFEAEQASKRELQEALERQTATSDVLSVISSSPGKLAPVFKAMLANAVRICNAKFGFMNLYDYDGDTWKIAAVHGAAPAYTEYLQQHGYKRPGPETVVARIARTKQMVHIADLAASRGYVERDAVVVAAVERGGVRTLLGVPMLKKDELIGAILLYHQEVCPFTEKQIELVTNFASQAVIAIENTRLFDEVQARTNELQEALEQQTATSGVLRAISKSPTDVQPVFDTIVRNAVQLCAARFGVLHRFDGTQLHLAAHDVTPEVLAVLRRSYPMRPSRSQASGRAILTRTVVEIRDVWEDPEYQQEMATAGEWRSLLAVPMLRADGNPIGTIVVQRSEPGPFASAHIEMLKTFADQAVIAIENVRLFEQVQARNRDLTALSEVGRAVSSTLNLERVLKNIIDRAVELSGTDGGAIFYYREKEGRFELGETAGFEEEVIARYRKLDIASGQTGLGEAIANREPLQLPDVTKRTSNPLRDAALEAGLHAALIVPLLGNEGALGALVLQRRRTGEFSPSVVSLMQSFADQSAIALENARLFEEIAQKSRELEIASHHKSQFVANMSHELRTPLAAILGYAELIQEGFYGPLPEKALDSLIRIRSNGKHLLGLINTVLDIAKIESGQFTLNMAEYAIESVVETVRSATESLAQNKRLALKTEVAKSMPAGLGDEQRLTQVLLNLVGNAIKFTDTGEVRVTAKAVNGHFNVSVTDTGPGIPAHHQTRIFEQFHQVDSSNTKAKGGTGLGLAIAKQIVEMHGGRIWVESTLGKGSTFQMELPTRAELQQPA